jgi:hypothetical protein
MYLLTQPSYLLATYWTPNLVGSNPNGGNVIQGGASADTIYGESSSDLFSGTVGCNLIYGGDGTNTIYGDAHGLFGTVYARGNTIWADGPSANDGSAVNTIYGNAYVMGNDATAAGNVLHDSYGNTSYLYGNADTMQDHAWGGYNTITALSSTSYVYGDAVVINGADSYDSVHGYGVQAGHNTIIFNSAGGAAYGDAYDIRGDFVGGHNTIYIGNQQYANVFGTARYFFHESAGVIQCGGNVIFAGSGNDTIVGDAFQNLQLALGGGNKIYAGSGTDTIYGDCIYSDGEFHNGLYADGTHAIDGNVISAGAGNSTIYGDCLQNRAAFWVDSSSGNYIYGDNGSGNLTIYGNCGDNSSTGTFHGGGNYIIASSGQDIIYGDCGTNENGGQFYGGQNTINAGWSGSTATIYGDCSTNAGAYYAIDGNTIHGDQGSGALTIVGDCLNNTGQFYGGSSTIFASSGSDLIYGDCQANSGTFTGGNNTIYAGLGNATIYGECFFNSGTFYASYHGQPGHAANTIYDTSAGSGTATIYGSCDTNEGYFCGTLVWQAGSSPVGNLIYGGSNNATIWGNCQTNTGTGTFVGGYNTIHAGSGAATIYGDCQFNSGTFYGGHNTIYAGTGNALGYQGNEDIWGGQGGSDKFVFAPGTGAVKIEDFDHHAGSAFSHAQGDVIDVSAYHLGGMQNLAIGANANGDAVIALPAAGASHGGQITLVGVHPGDLLASDFHF